MDNMQGVVSNVEQFLKRHHISEFMKCDKCKRTGAMMIQFKDGQLALCKDCKFKLDQKLQSMKLAKDAGFIESDNVRIVGKTKDEIFKFEI